MYKFRAYIEVDLFVEEGALTKEGLVERKQEVWALADEKIEEILKDIPGNTYLQRMRLIKIGDSFWGEDRPKGGT